MSEYEIVNRSDSEVQTDQAKLEVADRMLDDVRHDNKPPANALDSVKYAIDRFGAWSRSVNDGISYGDLTAQLKQPMGDERMRATIYLLHNFDQIAATKRFLFIPFTLNESFMSRQELSQRVSLYSGKFLLEVVLRWYQAICSF